MASFVYCVSIKLVSYFPPFFCVGRSFNATNNSIGNSYLVGNSKYLLPAVISFFVVVVVIYLFHTWRSIPLSQRERWRLVRKATVLEES